MRNLIAAFLKKKSGESAIEYGLIASLIAVGILTLTGLGIGILTGVLALLAGIFILIGR